ncbi:MAG: hypothetical protein H0V53_09155 [Rubrobacter sp.]|nr:hypothetical protein [Rubrobacter sp.]
MSERGLTSDPPDGDSEKRVREIRRKAAEAHPLADHERMCLQMLDNADKRSAVPVVFRRPEARPTDRK